MRYLRSIVACLALFAAAVQGQGSAPAIDASLAAYASIADSVRLPDGRSIHFVCMGHGSPAVILTAGLGDWSTSWSKVQPAIARTTRVCAWDRPGIGLSDASARPQSVETTTADLEAALAQGSMKGPYVLVGHSAGGFETLLYADRHPREVAGMVLVDPAVPGQAALLRSAAPAVAESSDAYNKSLVALIRRCVAEGRRGGSTSAECQLPFPPSYPPELLRALKEKARNPVQGEAVASFQENFDRSSEQAINPGRNYGDMPLIVLTATEGSAPSGASPEAVAQMAAYLEAFAVAHDRLAALSTRGVNARVPGTTHYIHQIKPQVVIDAVNQVVAEARASKR